MYKYRLKTWRINDLFAAKVSIKHFIVGQICKADAHKNENYTHKNAEKLICRFNCLCFPCAVINHATNCIEPITVFFSFMGFISITILLASTQAAWDESVL